MRSLGFDLGTRTLGVAVTDELGLIASPLKTIKFVNYEDLIDPISRLLDEYEIDSIVLGLPKNMDGTLGFAAKRSTDFKEFLLEHFDKEVVLVDERLSTMEAEMYLLDADMSRKKRKEHIDSVAASVILNTYIRMKGNKKDE